MTARERAATVATSGQDGGTVVLDDGTRLPYAAGVVGRQVRVLHPGQRVRLRLAETGPDEVTALTLVSLPLPDAP